MSQVTKKIFPIILAIASLFAISAAQKESRSEKDILDQLANDEKEVEGCERTIREEQIAKYGKVLPKLSGHCWYGECPIRIVLPYYPKEAKRLKIVGQVKVEIVLNEAGKVIYSKVIEGNQFLADSALKASWHVEYQPRKSCNGRPIMFRQVITYNFLKSSITAI